MGEEFNLNYIDRPTGSLIDRMIVEPKLEPVEVIMMTLDAVNFLEKGLYSVYREIPVRRLIICDGGSKDGTIEILKKYPRVELHVRPDIRTTGKTLEFLLSLVKTEWFVYIDGETELASKWYDEMCKHKITYDVIENSRRTNAYHFYRELKHKLDPDVRAYSNCHLVRKSAIQDFHCDDDYLWRAVDIFFRQVVENSHHKYGKISTTNHIHHDTERIPQESDEEKRFAKFVYQEPKFVIIDEKKFNRMKKNAAKEAVKYLDPEHPVVKKYRGFDNFVRNLDRKWVLENGSVWIKRYDRARSIRWSIKNFIYRHLIAPRKAKKTGEL